MLDLPVLPVKICSFVVFGLRRILLGTEAVRLAELEEITFWDCK